MKYVIIAALLLSQRIFAQGVCPKTLPADICEFETRMYTELDFKNTDQLKNTFLEFKELLIKHNEDSTLIQDHLMTLGTHLVEESYEERAPKRILAEADGKSNLLKMLKNLKAWEKKNAQIVPLDWHLPEGFIIAVANLGRSYDSSTDRIRYAISLYVPLEHPVDVEQLKISRFGGAVVFDKASGIGDWNEEQSPSAKFHYVSANSPRQDSPMSDGLYTITIKVRGQSPTEGWFFLHGTPVTSPVVITPQVNETFQTARPTFTFQDFKSTHVSIADGRKLTVHVFRQGDNATLWRTSVINPKNSSVSFGQESNQTGVESLESGAYRFNLVFEERSYFGDITIGRMMNTSVPFRVSH